MKNVLTHSREIVCWLSDRRLIYSIPIYFQLERDYFRSEFVDIEIERSAKKEFVLKEGAIKSYIIQPEVQPLSSQERYATVSGCCEKR